MQADIFYGCTVGSHLTRKTEADIRIDAQTLRREIMEVSEALLRKGELNFAIWLRSHGRLTPPKLELTHDFINQKRVADTRLRWDKLLYLLEVDAQNESPPTHPRHRP